MIIFIDTNIILDVLLKREPFYHDSYAVLERVIKENMKAYISASCITDIFYIAQKVIKDRNITNSGIQKLLSFIDVVNITKSDILQAIRMELDDLEDALQLRCALKIKAELIITRDVEFDGKEIMVIPPADFRVN